MLAYTYVTYLLVQYVLLHARTPLKRVCHVYLSIIVYWWQQCVRFRPDSH